MRTHATSSTSSGRSKNKSNKGATSKRDGAAASRSASPKAKRPSDEKAVGAAVACEEAPGGKVASTRRSGQAEDTEASRGSFTLSDDDRYTSTGTANPTEAGPFDVDNGYSRGRAKHGGGREEEEAVER